MGGRLPKGILLVLANCANPAREQAMNEWYNDVHIPDVTGSGLFGNARRYVNPSAKGTAEDPKYLATYETDREDVAEAWAENYALRSQWRPKPDDIPLAPTMLQTFKPTGKIAKAPTDKQARGLLVSLADCSDPAKEAEYNRWCDEEHVPDIMATGSYWSGTRYVNTSPETSHPRYLVIYESEQDGPAALAEMTKRLRPSSSPDFRLLRLAATFNLIYSQAGVKSGV